MKMFFTSVIHRGTLDFLTVLIHVEIFGSGLFQDSFEIYFQFSTFFDFATGETHFTRIHLCLSRVLKILPLFLLRGHHLDFCLCRINFGLFSAS
jgi:hypothetical protein